MSTIVKRLARLTRAMSAVTVLALVGCGGGGGGVATDTGIGAVGGIGGTGIKGPVSGATVNAYAIVNGVLDKPIGSAKTDGQGNFNVPIGSYAGPVMLQLSGGTYTDEATGAANMPMAAGDVMTAVLPSVAAGAQIGGVQMTPLTTMAQAIAQHMSAGMTDANIAAANTAVGGYFSVADIVRTPPMNPMVAGSGAGASQDAIDYGMTLAAMSQLAKSLGMTTSSAMVSAMMNDAADGMMDGKMMGSPVMMGGMGGGMGNAMPANAGSTGLATAMSAFANSAQNKSGVAASVMSALIAKLNASNGRIMGGATPSSAGTSISGTVVDGPVAMARVSAFALNDGVKGAQIGSATTDADGNFTLMLGGYAGAVMLQASGGSWTDAATGATVAMAGGDMMTVVLPTIPAGSAASGVQLTPVTSMAQAMAAGMAGGMTDANIAAANAALGNYFMIGDIVHTAPIDPSANGSGSTANPASMNYGMTLAAMSQYAKIVGMTVPSAMTTAMMNDAADGVMNGIGMDGPITMGGGMPVGGMMGGGSSFMQPGAATSGLAGAMADFMASSRNRSGVTASEMAALMQQLRTSNGRMH